MTETIATTKDTPQTRSERFIAATVERIQKDKGFAARLRRADNPTTEYQSWDYLAMMGINLENKPIRAAYVTIVAALAKHKISENGTRPLGQAIADSYEDHFESKQAKAKLRRVLACSTTTEVCRVLRSLLALIHSKTPGNLNFARLLQQLLSFQYEDGRERVKSEWAQEFYLRRHEPKGEQKEST
jgi:CRISPR system Cascade subunit CasB